MSNFNSFRRITEEPSHYDHLERMSTRELLLAQNEENHQVAEAVERALPAIEQLVNLIEPRLRQGGHLYYIGAGTSGRLGVLDASELPPTFGVAPSLVVGLIAGGDKALREAVENAEDDTGSGWAELQRLGINKLDTVVGIAASGTTPYVLGTLRHAHAAGILTACITSNPHSPIAAVSDVATETVVGPEFITGSSRLKSGTAQKMVLNMLSTTLMIRLGRVRGNRMVHMKLSNRKLIDRGTRMLAEALHLSYDHAQELLLKYGSVDEALKHATSPHT